MHDEELLAHGTEHGVRLFITLGRGPGDGHGAHDGTHRLPCLPILLISSAVRGRGQNSDRVRHLASVRVPHGVARARHVGAERRRDASVGGVGLVLLAESEVLTE